MTNTYKPCADHVWTLRDDRGSRVGSYFTYECITEDNLRATVMGVNQPPVFSCPLCEPRCASHGYRDCGHPDCVSEPPAKDSVDNSDAATAAHC